MGAERRIAERVGGRVAGWVLVDALVLLYALVPVLWILSLSLKPTSTVKDGKLIPSHPTFDNYRGIFRGNYFSSALVNSVGIGAMAAYAVARLDFPGKRVLIGATLLISMFPAISLVTPLFNIERRIGLFDTWPGLIIPYITFALPLSIYTLSAFFREIPRDLEKAAKMDGATPAQAGHPGVHLRVERPVAGVVVDRDQVGGHRAGGDRELHRQFAIRGAHRIDRGRRHGDHGADYRLCSSLPATDCRGLDVRCGEGIARWPRLCWTG
jgi:ABC-type spermidine/putrescine transport system permease subunit I